MKSYINKIKHTLLGKGQESIPNFAFRAMAGVMKADDFFRNSSYKKFKTLGLKEGQTVVDYGCGPARYVEEASLAVGPNGKVYAVDIHPLAIENVKSIISTKDLSNVEAIQAIGYKTPLRANSIDMLFALDMFHMISSPEKLLSEFHRILSHKGMAIIEDGHQKRSETKEKINTTNLFIISEETNTHVKCHKKY